MSPNWGVYVGHQFATAGVLKKRTPNRTVRFEAAEHVSASAVEKIRNSPQDFALGAFARARGAEQQNRAIVHVQ